MEMISVQGWVLGSNDYDTSSASRANSPVWTKQTQDWFFHSAESDEREDHVPDIVLVTGDASVTMLPNSLNNKKM